MVATIVPTWVKCRIDNLLGAPQVRRHVLDLSRLIFCDECFGLFETRCASKECATKSKSAASLQSSQRPDKPRVRNANSVLHSTQIRAQIILGRGELPVTRQRRRHLDEVTLTRIFESSNLRKWPRVKDPGCRCLAALRVRAQWQLKGLLP